MRKTMLSLLCIGLAIGLNNTVSAQLTAKVFEDPNCEQIVKEHKTIALLPVEVIMTDNRPNKKKRASPEELEKQALLYQKGFQNSMYAWFLKRKGKGKMVDVDIQDVDRTNTILKKNGIENTADLEALTKDEIAEILGVDAVFGGRVSTNVTMGAGGAFAASLVFGSIASKTGEANVFIKLWDGKSGDMIWSFGRRVSSSYASSPESVVWIFTKP